MNVIRSSDGGLKFAHTATRRLHCAHVTVTFVLIAKNIPTMGGLIAKVQAPWQTERQVKKTRLLRQSPQEKLASTIST
jgi:hypothetical protein